MKSKAARLRELISQGAVMMPGVPNASMARQVEAVENASEHKAALEKQLGEAAQQYEASASELSGVRTAAAAKLSKQVESELKALAMAGTQFQVKVVPSESVLPPTR